MVCSDNHSVFKFSDLTPQGRNDSRGTYWSQSILSERCAWVLLFERMQFTDLLLCDRCRVAWLQTSWTHRLIVSQFLCSPCCLRCHEGWRRGTRPHMRRWKTGTLKQSANDLCWIIIQRLTSIQKFFDGQVWTYLGFVCPFICNDKRADTTFVHFFVHLLTPQGYILHLDKDTATKRLFWYTISETSRSSRNGIPEKYKREFAEKSITCGKHFVHVICL